MNKWVLVGVLICFVLAPAGVIAAEQAPSITYKEEAAGLVTVTIPASGERAYKIRISKGTEHYTYGADDYNVFPLQMGDGTYIVILLEQVIGNTYKLVEQQQISYKAQALHEVFLHSIQNIQWDYSMDPALKAAELTKSAATDYEKIKAIHQFVVNNMSYDYEKAKTITSGYIPSVEKAYATMSGICYDYAALVAAMLRSVDVPTKLVMGYRSDMSEYHAWNEVYVKETDEWMTLDTTYEAAWKEKQATHTLFQDPYLFTPEHIY